MCLGFEFLSNACIFRYGSYGLFTSKYHRLFTLIEIFAEHIDTTDSPCKFWCAMARKIARKTATKKDPASKATRTKKEAENGPLHSMPADLKKALNSKSEVKAVWDGLTPLAKNEWICWVTSPKKPETRVKRIARALDDLANGKRGPCCWPGCPHRRPTAAKWF